MVCVDVFMRPDATFGFDEFRRDAEDLRGWFSIGHHGEKVFPTLKAAVLEARNTVRWLGQSNEFKAIFASGGDI